jgi:hypothetical protein
MSFKEFFSESGNALKKLDIQVSRINKQDFSDLRNLLEPVLKEKGLSQHWTMGSAGSWAKEHPYYSETSVKQDAGDVDVMVDSDDIIKAFPPIPKKYRTEPTPEKLYDDHLASSKLQLSQYLDSKGFPNTGQALNMSITINGKNVQVDLIPKKDSSSAIHGHTMDYSQDVGMRGSDLWLHIYPKLMKLIPSPISGKTSVDQIDRVTGEPKSALQLSPDKGVVDRETGKLLLPWSQKDKIAQLILGAEATARDMSSLSGIKKILQKYPEKWNAVKNFFETRNESFNILAEGIEHVEDRVITGGYEGAVSAFKELASLVDNSDTVTIKWDGFPAIIWGWVEAPSRQNPAGKFLFVDKHMYDKIAKGKMEYSTIIDYDKGRGSNRTSLWEAESLMVPVLKRITPAKQNQFFFGDLMWHGMPKVENGYYIFKPNTVEYRVKIDSNLGNTISRSIAGVAIHTFIPSMGGEDRPLKGLQGLKQNEGITLLVGEIEEKPRIAISTNILSQTQEILKQHKAVTQKFFNSLEEIRAKSVVNYMSQFITYMLNENDIASNIVPRYLTFLKSKLSAKQSQFLLGNNMDGWLYREGAAGLLGIWSMWAALTDLKLNVKRQIDIQQNGLPIQARIGEDNSHEGYVFGSGKNKLKLIDRLGFSRANFAKNANKPEEVADKSNMPLAVFCFGRMNPPTIGHRLLMQKTVEKGGVNSFIFLSNTQNSKKDPLDPNVKAEFVKKIYPEFASHIVSEKVMNPIQAANYLYAKGFRNMVFVAGADRLGDNQGSLEKLLTNWNSGAIRSKDFNFGPSGREQVALKFISSGDRDADSDVNAVSGISASLARKFATEKNEEGFQQATGVDNKITVNGKTLYQAVREGLGLPLQESFKKFLLARL